MQNLIQEFYIQLRVHRARNNIVSGMDDKATVGQVQQQSNNFDLKKPGQENGY